MVLMFKPVMYGLNIITMAILVPTTLMHQHNLMVELESDVSIDDVVETFEKTPRVILVDASRGLGSTAEIMEYAKDSAEDLEGICLR